MTWAAILTLLEPLIEAALKAFGSTFNQAQQNQQGAQAQRDAGASGVSSTINKEAANAERRASAAAAQAPDADRTVSDLERGIDG